MCVRSRLSQIVRDLDFETEVAIGVCLDPSYEQLPAELCKASNVGLCDEVLLQALSEAADHSIVFVITTIPTNLAFFLQRNGELVAAKLSHVAIFGTVCMISRRSRADRAAAVPATIASPLASDRCSRRRCVNESTAPLSTRARRTSVQTRRTSRLQQT